ncbi:hypothetical protein TanjilG_06678 [Lupinus angustifolius]|uniref:Uncharacterized protein n=1 Tax=Lupinus angustifolius TaxID=3871 RepID=A0A1J7H5G7_LUPAN|nr:PREDICTED: transcription factor GAMYB-like [Lupinus angustifolius]XP_019449332.1 PREDICTED: transcription factor GAMYB-like [Lupinus angustifolius]XP_019449333.1 PREDICTED: transcription factor GAMYB-like [Lupinus angustifolius]XP_019449334.1 PREDICTED: transcription factor GAMYB-like [Lupinus angustifolius]XP_019449335.1 PREDICTED: transcription factor GAMYB-like [Lupinus angustifolius]OIW08135.1 hypothetical protein TanjilG_06678 [Lupinus angustifolius]
MRRVKNNEIEDEMLPNDLTESQLNDEGDGGSASGVILKKGPWTSTEDAILVEYVKKHGEGNWNAVQKHSGLSRCGKSCRLRWANHLRPNLKKGAFTAQEERLITELHAKMGNKWARMAAHLPGRTDNEIKNYWNTRIKRRQRAGLPLYPPEVCLQAFQESQQRQSTGGGHNAGNKVRHDFLHKNSYEIHDAIFDSLKDNQGISPYVPELPDISDYSNMLKDLDSSQYFNFAPSTSPNHKRLRESTMPFLGSSDMHRNVFYPFDHIQDNASFGMQSPLDHGPSSHSSMCYSHSFSNGNSSTSKSTYEAVKLELPSLQYPEIDLGSWGTSPPPPLLDSVDDFIQSPTPISAMESDSSSPHNSGLLDALVYQSKTMSSSKNHYSNKSSNSSTATPGHRADSSTLNMYETELEDHTDPVSPFGATSILNECPAVANANSFDETLPDGTFNGNIVKLESADQVWTPNSENQNMSELNITRPDLLLDADWLQQDFGHGNNQTITTDVMSTLFADDLATDYKHMTVGTSKSSQVWGFGSCARNNNVFCLSGV